MTQATYRHYPSFTRRYVRSVMKMLGLPKKPRIEAEIFGEMVHDEQVVHSINGEILMLEWHHGREGRVVVPEPSLSEWLQTVQLSRVQGDAWSWPWEFSSLSFPAKQIFHGHSVHGALVAWLDSTMLPARYEAFLSAHGNMHGVDMQGLGDPWLIVAIHNPLDTRPGLNPTMLRGAFRPSQITDFINREAIEHAGGHAQPLADQEGMILRAVVRYVLSLGMYLSAYPEALSSGVPGWMKNKHPEGRKGVPFAHIGYDREDRELKAAMTAPRTVAPYWRQLRDERFYRGKWADHRRGSRYVLVSGYEVGGDRTVGVGAADQVT
ncbi:hypothetical protein [Halomonas sp. LBP4]|uniref:hypothetical protein n=1 Tax=Halomonas sp. LBP4 TaxID=2044917 RepID=UPI000D75C1D3|nr:hypothetical protein [Halomonas sp. LBP4]PXX95905.1 hypothetical protein CR157_17045 [Halomonas sp. LBP4]